MPIATTTLRPPGLCRAPLEDSAAMSRYLVVIASLPERTSTCALAARIQRSGAARCGDLTAYFGSPDTTASSFGRGIRIDFAQPQCIPARSRESLERPGHLVSNLGPARGGARGQTRGRAAAVQAQFGK